MISCTEFIPAYSELFSYIDKKDGHKGVEKFWEYLFKPDGKGIPLINFAKKNGIRGCWEYWNGTLKEEASDVTMMLNEKGGWFYSHMHHCPSKGRLLELQKEIGLTPYYDYCGHCDYYRSALEEVGLTWTRNHLYVDRAECSRVLYDPKVFKGVMVKDDNTEIVEMHSDGAEYFHRDFHSSLNMGIDYVAKKYGLDGLKEYLREYTLHVYKPVFNDMKNGILGAIEKQIRKTYELEKATEVLHMERSENSLKVKIDYCPAVKHLRETGREVSEYFNYSTEIVMGTFAEKGGLDFVMKFYDKETGAAEYEFKAR